MEETSGQKLVWGNQDPKELRKIWYGTLLSLALAVPTYMTIHQQHEEILASKQAREFAAAAQPPAQIQHASYECAPSPESPIIPASFDLRNTI